MATQCAAQFEPFAWSLTRGAIGQALRKRYAVTTELPRELLALVRKLAAARDRRQFRTPVRILDALEGNYLLRYVSPVEPRSVGPSGTDWRLTREVAMNTPIIAVIIVVAFMVGSALSIMNKACKRGYHAWCAPMSTTVRHHVKTQPPA